VDESRRGGDKSTGTDVEGTEVILEIDVKPLAPRLSCLVPCTLDERCPDPTASMIGGDHRVLNPGMDETVPDDVDESDEVAFVTGSNPPKGAPGQDGSPISPLGRSRVERLGVKTIDLGIVEVVPPPVGDGTETSCALGSHVSGA